MSKHHVFPRLKPGGRKTLKDGLKAQGYYLLFHNLIVLPKKSYKQFTDKKFSRGRFNSCRRVKHRHWLRSPIIVFCMVNHKNDHTRVLLKAAGNFQTRGVYAPTGCSNSENSLFGIFSGAQQMPMGKECKHGLSRANQNLALWARIFIFLISFCRVSVLLQLTETFCRYSFSPSRKQCPNSPTVR